MANKRFSASFTTKQPVVFTVAALMALFIPALMLTPARSQMADAPAAMSDMARAAIMPAGDKQIVGVVINEKKQPVAGIYVGLYWQWSFKMANGNVRRGSRSASQATTDAQGRFVFPNLSAGQFRYSVFSPKNEYLADEEPLLIEKEDTQKTLSIVVLQGALVTGRVVDEKTGKPLLHIFVVAGPIPPGGSMADWSKWPMNDTGVTDAQGHYQIRVASGNVVVGVVPIGSGSPINQRVLEATCRLAAPNGKTVTAPDLSVLLRPMLVFVGSDGKPLANAAVRLIPNTLMQGGSITDNNTDVTGAVVLGQDMNTPHADSGAFSIIQGDLAASGTYHWLPKQPLVVKVNGQETAYPDGVATITLLPGSTSPVTGTVVSENGTPISNALVRVFEMDPRSHSGIGDRLFKTDASGIFRAPLDPSGDYRAYVRADGFNQVSISNTPLVVVPGKPTDLGTIRLVKADGSVSGRVVNAAGKPMEGVLACVQGDKTGISAAVTDAEGKFRIPNVIPGERLILKLNRHGEAPDSGQALWQSNESMDIPDAYATTTPVKIVWRPK